MPLPNSISRDTIRAVVELLESGIVIGGSSDPAIEALDETDTTGDGVEWPGGPGVSIVNGTWDSATASLEWSEDDNVWWSPGYSLTADGLIAFTLPAGFLRIAIGSAGGSTELSAIIKRS